jgi:hypothetical protein
MVARGITAGTRQGYHAAFALWGEFVEGSDDCQTGDLYLDNVEITSHPILINRFMDWAVVTKGVAPTVAVRMVTGVRHYFQISHHPTESFDCEQVHKAKRTTLSGTGHIRHVERIGRGEPLPFTVELAAKARESHWADPRATVDMKMAYIGVALGVAGGFRPGEIAYTGPYVGDPTYPKAKAEDHRHFTTDLVFESQIHAEGGQSIFTYDEARMLPAPRPIFELIRLTTDSSKTSRGKADGFTRYFAPGTDMETQFLNDLTRWLLDLCNLPVGEPGGHMICSRYACVSKQIHLSTYKKLTSKMYVDLIKLVARQNSLPESCFSGKSPRVNAITSAEMAGMDGSNTTGHQSAGGAAAYARNIHSKKSAKKIGQRLGLPGGSFTNAFAVPLQLSVQDLARAVSQRQCLVRGRSNLASKVDYSKQVEEIVK